MGVTLVQFQKILIFEIDFRIDLGSLGGQFGVIFGIWSDFGALSEPIRRRKASLKDTLGSLGATLGQIGLTLRRFGVTWG